MPAVRRSARRPGRAARSGAAPASTRVTPGHRPRPGRPAAPARSGRWAAVAGWSPRPTCAGERGQPGRHASTWSPSTRAGRATSSSLLGPASEVGRALAGAPSRPRPRRPRPLARRASARAGLRRRGRLPPRPDGRPGASRPASWPPACSGSPASTALPAVLTNAVRYADPPGAATADVLDAARRLVALDARHVDRVNAEGYLKPGTQMQRVAERGRPARPGEADGCAALLAATRASPTGACSTRAPTSVSARSTCPSSTSLDSGRRAARRGGPARALRGRARRALRATRTDPRRPGPARRRARRHRRTSATRPTSSPSPRSCDLIRDDGRPGRRARLRRRQPRQLPARDLRGRPDAPRAADGTLPLPAAAGAARRRHRRRVRPPHRGLRADPRALRRRAGAPACR